MKIFILCLVNSFVLKVKHNKAVLEKSSKFSGKKLDEWAKCQSNALELFNSVSKKKWQRKSKEKKAHL